jgi:multidrug efflux pump
MKKFIKNTRLLILFVAVLLITGLSALSQLPRAEDPPLTNRWATITTLYPGASASRVETLVTEELENALRSLNEIALIESQSKPGISVVSIELNENLTATETVWSKIRDKISDSVTKLPSEAHTPKFDNQSNDAYTYITALEWQGAGEPDLLLMGRYAKELAKRWRNLSGTELVTLHGSPEEEILVTLDLAKSSALGYSPLSIAERIHQADSKTPSGELYNPHSRFQIELSDGLESVVRVKNISIAQDKQSSIISLEDIATVTKTKRTPEAQIALINGKAAILISARMQKKWRVDTWTNNAKTLLNDFRAELPEQLQLSTIFEQDRYTQTRLTDLINNLCVGFGLILAVLFLTLGIRSAILVAFSLPLSATFTLAMMQFTDLPINQMSVTGLIVSLGIMVDNAIVMVDTIQHYRRQGIKQLEAAMKAIRHLWMPLLGSTLTTILAFSPIFLMPGAAGEFVGAIALTVSFSLLGSYLVSMLLVSSFAARWLPSGQQNQAWYQTGLTLPSVSQGFKSSIKNALIHPKLTLLIVLLFPFTGFWAVGQLTEQFFPSSDRDMFEIQVFLAPHSSIDASLKTTQAIEALLKKEKDIETIGWVLGANFPSFYYNMMGRQHGAPDFAQAMIKTTDFHAANEMIPRLQKQLSDALPHAQILVRKLEQGPPFNAPLEVRVFGPNLETLREISEKIRAIMASTPHVTNIRETLIAGSPKVALKVKDAASQAIHWSQRDIASLIHASTTGITQNTMTDKSESLPIRVRFGDEQRQTASDILQIQLPIANQHSNPLLSAPAFIPLSAIASVDIVPSRGAIPHRNGERLNVIEGYIEAGVLPQTVLDAFLIKLEQANLALAPGYRIELGGESAERNESVSQLLANLTIVITLLITVIVVSFNSFRLSTIIFIVGVQAAGSGLLSVWLFNYPFGFTVIIGVLGLVGLAINAAIVILAELQDNKEAQQGNINAIVETVSGCGRHISSTTITTIGGFLPLILAGGGFWPPFAIAIAGGTLLTTLISFYFVPVAYKLASNYRDFSKKDPLDLANN